MQIAERGDTQQKTDVEWLDAEVLECADEANRHIVSVRFNGQIRESADSQATTFDEIWHLSRPASGPGGWVVAGIQQG
jgi:predicted lipid-binding transport protein (Tim44 family)